MKRRSEHAGHSLLALHGGGDQARLLPALSTSHQPYCHLTLATRHYTLLTVISTSHQTLLTVIATDQQALLTLLSTSCQPDCHLTLSTRHDTLFTALPANHHPCGHAALAAGGGARGLHRPERGAEEPCAQESPLRQPHRASLPAAGGAAAATARDDGRRVERRGEEAGAVFCQRDLPRV